MKPVRFAIVFRSALKSERVLFVGDEAVPPGETRRVTAVPAADPSAPGTASTARDETGLSRPLRPTAQRSADVSRR